MGNAKKHLLSLWDTKGSLILTGFGVAGVFTTMILAAKAAPTSVNVLTVAKDELNREDISEEEKKQLKKDSAIEILKLWAPALVSAGATTACIIGAHSKSMRKQAALAVAYNLSETALESYKEKTKALVGEKKELEIRDGIAKDKIASDPPKDGKIIFTGNGDYLCYDSTSGRYFYSNIQDVKAAVNDMNQRLISEMYLSLNEYYDYLDLPHITVGDDLGWSVERPLQLHESYQSDDKGTPCLVVDFLYGPTPMFREF